MQRLPASVATAYSKVGRSIRRSSSARVTNLQPTVVGAKRGQAREGFASSGLREVTGLGEGSGTPDQRDIADANRSRIDRPPTEAAQKGKPPKRRPFEVKMRRRLSCALEALTSQLISRRGLFRCSNLEHSPMRIANPFVVIIHVIGSLLVIHDFAQHRAVLQGYCDTFRIT
jgi:hypothetical protein